MRRIFTIGQSVFDIMFKDEHPFAAKVGGSMLNSSVSLGRLGLDVFFLGEFGNDLAGNITLKFLKGNNVNTDYCYLYDKGQTTISLAFLDSQKNAEYNFYRNKPPKRLQLPWPEVTEQDIILFGSFYIFEEAIENKIYQFLKEAKTKGAFLVYDPNFRKPHYNMIDQLKPKFLKFFEMADIVRGSDEDFYGIFNESIFENVTSHFENHKGWLISTSSQKVVNLKVENIIVSVDVPEIYPVSTIGAGDTFNAGVIYGIVKENIQPDNLNTISKDKIKKILETAVSFASEVCLSEDNYLSKEYCEDFIIFKM